MIVVSTLFPAMQIFNNFAEKFALLEKKFVSVLPL